VEPGREPKNTSKCKIRTSQDAEIHGLVKGLLARGAMTFGASLGETGNKDSLSRGCHELSKRQRKGGAFSGWLDIKCQALHMGEAKGARVSVKSGGHCSV